MKRFDDLLYQITKGVSVILLSSLVILCILQVVCRYVLHISLSFTEELARYLFIWVTFLGSAMAVKKHKHVNMDLLINILPESVRKGVNLAIRLFLVIMYLVLVYSGVVAVMKTMNETSPAMQLPMGYIYLAIPVSMLVMTVFEVCDCSKRKEQ